MHLTLGLCRLWQTSWGGSSREETRGETDASRDRDRVRNCLNETWACRSDVRELGTEGGQQKDWRLTLNSSGKSLISLSLYPALSRSLCFYFFTWLRACVRRVPLSSCCSLPNGCSLTCRLGLTQILMISRDVRIQHYLRRNRRGNKAALDINQESIHFFSFFSLKRKVKAGVFCVLLYLSN